MQLNQLQAMGRQEVSVYGLRVCYTNPDDDTLMLFTLSDLTMHPLV